MQALLICMHIVIIAVDKLREPYLRDGCALYLERLSAFGSVSVREIRPPGNITAEGQAILRAVSAEDALWALDQRGRMLSSLDVAAALKKVEASGRRRLAIAIGGASGLAESVRKRADLLWSLSHLTFLHEMARLIALEQLYRAMKINRNEPYHR